jgi:hypothetical protein
VKAVNELGCFLGTPIVGEPVNPPKLSRAKARYQHYLDIAECYESFADYLGIKKRRFA